MAWIKVFHIVLVTSWFAGLFYLPRIFVNLAMLAPSQHDARQVLLGMAKRLSRFMSLLAVLALACGLWLWLGLGFSGGWLHAKLSVTLALILYHGYCQVLLKRLHLGLDRHSPRWFRVFNEIPVILLLLAVALVVIKPF